MMEVTTEQVGPMAREATRLLKALAHPSRLLICCQLRDGEMSVGRIETTLGIRQPNLSRELARLREDGIVTTRRESRVVFYRLQDPRAGELIEAVCGVMMGTSGAGGAPSDTDESSPQSTAVGGSEQRLDAATDATAGGSPLYRVGGYGVFARASDSTGRGRR